jgi:hypothetical protein
MFLWGVMADRTSSDLEYSIQVTLFGAWSVLGVISGIAPSQAHRGQRLCRESLYGPSSPCLLFVL